MALKYRVKYALSLSLKVPIFYGHRIFCLKISAPCAFHCLYASVHLTPRNAFLETALRPSLIAEIKFLLGVKKTRLHCFPTVFPN